VSTYRFLAIISSMSSGRAHGALSNDLADDEVLADALADGVLPYGGGLSVLALARHPPVAVLEGAGVPVAGKAFADRGHTPVGRLGPRSEPGAVIADVADRGPRIATGEAIAGPDGNLIRVQAGTQCRPSDIPEGVLWPAALRRAPAEVPFNARAFE
jgi:UPF0271 protein